MNWYKHLMTPFCMVCKIKHQLFCQRNFLVVCIDLDYIYDACLKFYNLFHFSFLVSVIHYYIFGPLAMNNIR